MEGRFPPKRRQFSAFETKTLLACTEKHKKIIESKVTNAVTNREKAEAWTKVCEEFNRIPGITAKTNVVQLQNLYRNLKRRARVADERAALIKIGGEKKATKAVKNVDERVFSMRVIREPLPSPYDSDFVLEMPIESEPTLPLSTYDPSTSEPSTSDSISQETPKVVNSSTPRLLSGYFFRKKQKLPASVKVAEALQESTVARKNAVENESKLAQQKLLLEIQQSKELHEMKVKVQQAKLSYYESLMKMKAHSN